MSLAVEPQDWDRLEAGWSGLLERVHQPGGVFLTPQFQRAWWDVYGAGYVLDLCAVRDGDRLVGVLPFQRSGATAALIGDPNVCDYQDVPAEPAQRTAVLDALLDRYEQSDVRRIDLWGLPEASPTLDRLPAAAEARGWRVRRDTEAVCPTVSLVSGWSAYLDTLDGRQRREVRRKLRNLLDGGARVGFVAVEEPEAIRRAFPEFLAMMRASRGDKAEFLSPQNEAFFQALARRLGDAGLLGLYLLRLDGRPAAAVLGFDHDGTLMLYNSGYDPALRDRNVGLASKVFCVRHAVETGKRAINFLRGEEDYKYQLGGRSSPVTRLVLERFP